MQINGVSFECDIFLFFLILVSCTYPLAMKLCNCIKHIITMLFKQKTTLRTYVVCASHTNGVSFELGEY